MLYTRSLASSFVLTLMLGACQPDRPAEAGHASPTVQPVPQVLPLAPTPTAAKATPPATVRPEKQTLFPDSLHPIALTTDYWTGRQLDSIRAALPNIDTIVMGSNVVQWATRCRVLRTDEDTGKRLFFRPRGATSSWVELDLNTWMDNYNSQPYLNARAVELDQRPPQELLVALGGSFAGQGQREMEDYTLLISFDGPPHIVWYSLDGRQEEISPTFANAQGEMLGGNYASARREITVRRGQVRVGRVRQDGKFETGDELVLTPITPGSYQYRAGRFRRVSP